MSENVGRKKSQRWVSVSKGNYGGQDWDSSEDEMEAGEVQDDGLARNTTVRKLPPLPKLSYGKDAADVADDTETNPVRENLDVTEMSASEASATTSRRSSLVHSGFAYSESDEECRVPKSGYFANIRGDTATPEVNHQEASETSAGSENDLRQGVVDGKLQGTMSIADDQGDQMDNIAQDESIVHKPVTLENDFTQDGTQESTSSDNTEEDTQGSPGSQESIGLDQPEAGMSTEHIGGPEAHEEAEIFTEHNGEAEIHEEVKVTSLLPSVGSGVSSSSNKDDKAYSQSEVESTSSGEAGTRSLSSPTTGAQTSSQIATTAPTENSLSRHSRSSSASSSSDDLYEENSSFLNHYGTNSTQSSPAINDSGSPSKLHDSSPLKIRQTSRTVLNHSDENLNSSDDIESFKFKERIRDSIVDSSSSDSDEDNESVLRIPKDGYYAKVMNEYSQDVVAQGNDNTDEHNSIEDSDEISTETGSITKSISDFGQSTDQEDRQLSIASSRTFNVDVAAREKAEEASPRSSDETKDFNSRQSINLGKWQPDTNATRAGFLGDVPTAPEGYVIDRDGQKIDLNPSGMRNMRALSTYTDAESTWNAFPASGGDTQGDLDTIYDTKTIYDNQTIYNVPGIATNTDSLPPLPHDISAVYSGQTNLITDSDSILKHLNGEKRQHTSNLKEDFSVHAPDSTEIAQLDGKAVPRMDLNSLLQMNKKLHSVKLRELEGYSSELQGFDSGLQTWINYALKSSASEKDYIFQDYKVSKHVRDAYAHADELSKKVSVSNTVANVNQNVSHLKRKMFSQSMKEKSKGLFSSIGKKKA
ncbi:LADA_0F09912g1_1 [Lachancea dasiensis]|uniref:LADA_0F09912g1_1 n=1 Tax=Lachancea dasiensis TaxID=1072105 RepID=A0A1G4JM48_9SACH|nr:LADA_0F09912g1_1 [Lachancea dasiensis]